MEYYVFRGFLRYDPMMKFKLAALLLILLGIQACKPKTNIPAYNDTFSSGDAKFAADESFEPIVDAENYVFKALDPKANPKIVYKSENDVVNLLLQDSVRVVVISRNLDSNEVKVLKTRNLTPVTSKFALDAVTLIVNKASNDTLITVGEIKKMLNGQTKTGNTNNFKLKNVFSLQSSKDVIKYVSAHPDAIGFTGFNWLDDPDADYANAVNNVKIMGVSDEDSKKYATQYFKPSQVTLSEGQYPLSRYLYVINCTNRQGLGTGFATFLTSERGQKIILSSGLLPAIMPGREIQIEHKLK